MVLPTLGFPIFAVRRVILPRPVLRAQQEGEGLQTVESGQWVAPVSLALSLPTCSGATGRVLHFSSAACYCCQPHSYAGRR